MELPKGQHRVSRQEFWKSHIDSAQEFSGSNKKYCDQQGLHYGTFCANRRRLGYSGRQGAKASVSSAFSEVKVNLSGASPLNAIHLPDPRWLAQLLKALGSPS